MFCVGTTDIDDYASEKDDAWYEDADNDDNDDDVDDDDADDDHLTATLMVDCVPVTHWRRLVLSHVWLRYVEPSHHCHDQMMIMKGKNIVALIVLLLTIIITL